MRLRPIWFVEPTLSVLARGWTSGRNASVEIEAVRTRSSDQQYEALLAGEADVAVTAMDNVIAWNRRGAATDFRIVAQVEATTPLTLMARPGLDDLKDLRQATILVDAPGNGFVVALRAFLADAGVPVDESRLVPAGGVTERFEALLAGKGDVTLLGPPFDVLAQQRGAQVLGRIQDLYPTFPGQGAVVRATRIAPIAMALGAWLDGLAAARRRCEVEPADARATLVAAGVFEAAIAGMIATLPASLVPDPDGIELVIAHRRRLGLPGGDDTCGDLVELLPSSTRAAAV